MTTPILKITEAANGQVDQYLTYNEALRALESSTNNFYVVDMSGGDVTLTDAANADPALNYIFSRNQVFRTSGNTVARVLTVPQSKRLFVVQNGGTFALTVKRGAAEVAVSAAGVAILYCDGTANGLVDIVNAGSSVSGPANSVDNEIALFSGTTGKLLKRGSVVGTAAGANVTTSAIDATPGALTKTGDAGWLGLNSSTETNANNFTIAANYQLSAGSPASFSNFPSWADPSSSTLLVMGNMSPYGMQMYFDRTLGRSAYRVYNGSFGPWREFWTDANLVKTTSSTDTTAGRVLVVGSGGLLGTSSYQSNYDFNATGQVMQGRTLASASPGTKPSADIAGFPDNCFVLPAQRSSNNNMVQVAIAFDGAYSRMAHRHYSGTTWSPWVESWTTGNTSANVQAMLSAANNAAIRSAISSSSLPPYTLGTAPSAAANTNLLIVITDLTGGREPCYSDGANWLRCSDKTIAS